MLAVSGDHREGEAVKPVVTGIWIVRGIYAYWYTRGRLRVICHRDYRKQVDTRKWRLTP